jgi:hypothetical protein
MRFLGLKIDTKLSRPSKLQFLFFFLDDNQYQKAGLWTRASPIVQSKLLISDEDV